MRISYNKLQKLMIDNQMKRQDLMRAAEISSSVATKLNKNETVSLDVLMRICKVFLAYWVGFKWENKKEECDPTLKILTKAKCFR